MSKIVPHLWFATEAEQAAHFYVSLLADSRVDTVTTMPADTPGGPEGSVQIVEFTLAGQPYVAFNGGPFEPFTHAVSLMILCDTQDEIDRLWGALSQGGSTEQCGWLKDRWGVSWQIAPRRLSDMIKDPDRERARRATAAMLGMVKLDLAALQRAYDGVE